MQTVILGNQKIEQRGKSVWHSNSPFATPWSERLFTRTLLRFLPTQRIPYFTPPQHLQRSFKNVETYERRADGV